MSVLTVVLAGVLLGYPGKAPWRDAVDVFTDGEAVPGLPKGYVYGFQIPILVNTNWHEDGKPGGTLLAFAQAYVVDEAGAPLGVTDGNDGWIDIVMRRSLDGGSRWDPELTVVLRNSSLALGEYHACQQPAPVVDLERKKVFLLSSLDNWHQLLQESGDDGKTWTPSAAARNLDASLRRPGWGLVFTGLPGGIQLMAPNPYPGRLVVCSSAYWDAKDPLSRYSYTIISDDHGATWRIGSDKIQPRHSTECSVAQRHDGAGEVFVYTRIWQKTCSGCVGFGRGIAMSSDGGVTFDAASLRGLPDTTPDVEGSFVADLVTIPANETADGKPFNSTCFYVSAPTARTRTNLTMWKSCGPTAPDVWSAAQVVDPGSASYSAVGIRHRGTGTPKLYNLWAWTNGSETPNACAMSGGVFPRNASGHPGPGSKCTGGIRFAEVGFKAGPGCGHYPCCLPGQPGVPKGCDV